MKVGQVHLKYSACSGLVNKAEEKSDVVYVIRDFYYTEIRSSKI
jgi:hypothetical protein